MKTLIEYIREAESEGRALGHFNISNVEGFWAVVNAAEKLNLPVVIGISEGERDFLGIAQTKALVDTMKAIGRPVFLNADHTYSVDRVKEVVDAGYDSVIIDEADKNFDENVSVTKEAVDYARANRPGMLVEAELGFIGKSSKILDSIPEGAGVSPETETKPEEAKEFVEKTGVDLFAPSVGNIHGLVKGGEPKLNIDRIREIKSAVNIPLVLHGASGNGEEEIREAIKAGISLIHINTELRIAYKQGLQRGLSENPEEVAPYKFLKEAVKEMQALVEKKLKLFNNMLAQS